MFLMMPLLFGVTDCEIMCCCEITSLVKEVANPIAVEAHDDALMYLIMKIQ